MNELDRILIALDLSDEDDTVLAYATRLFRLVQPKQIDVVHVLDTRMVPDAILSKYNEWLLPARRRRDCRLKERVSAGLVVHEATAVRRHILSGEPLAQILTLSRKQRCTLIITGRNRQGGRVATLPARVARRAACSVLVVPQASRARIERVLVPIDFTRGSVRPVELAGALMQRALVGRLRGLHAYGLPPGARDSGKTESELAELVRTYCVRAYERFREGLSQPAPSLEMDYVVARNPARAVLQAAQPEHCDLVVLGGRAGNATDQGQLGRVAARVLYGSRVPVLVVPRRDEEPPLASAASSG